MEVLEMVKHDAVQVNVLGASHTIKLLSFLEKEGRKSIERWKLEIAEHDLIWYITAKAISKFKYHVNLIGGAITFYGDGVRYVGDLPDFALDRAELALSLGIEMITLHSMLPLPIKRVHIDPVMIGWLQHPAFFMHVDNRPHSCNDSAEGVVLAIWNNEKEFEL